MVRMVGTKEHVYAGRRFGPGDEFDVEPGHVDLFVKVLQCARVKDDAPAAPSVAPAQEYRTRDMAAAGRRSKKA